MASSRVMPSSSLAAKSDLVHPPPSIYPLNSATGTTDPDPSPSSLNADFPAGSANMDDLLRNLYVEAEAQTPTPLPTRDGAGKTTEEVWKEIAAAAGRATAGSDGHPPAVPYGAMTLEDFLSRQEQCQGRTLGFRHRRRCQLDLASILWWLTHLCRATVGESTLRVWERSGWWRWRCRWRRKRLEEGDCRSCG